MAVNCIFAILCSFALVKSGGQTALEDPALQKVGGQLTPLTRRLRGHWLCCIAFTLLCRRTVGHITRLARPSVCLPSRSCSSLKNRIRRKIIIGVRVPQGTGKWKDQLKRSKVEVIGRQKSQEITAYLAYVFTYGRPIKRRRLRHRLQIRPRQLDGRPHIMSALCADIFSSCN